MASWFDIDGPVLGPWNRGNEGNVNSTFRPSYPDLPPAFAHRAAGTHEPKAHRPPHVASKLRAALAYLHWLNAKVVGAHRRNDTPGRGAP